MSKRWAHTVLVIGLAFAGLLAHPVDVRADRLVYVVESGDALSRLARRYNVTVQQLREWNEIDGDVIRVGQELVVFPDSAGNAGTNTYVVAPGDTLGDIARRHDVTVEEIVSWNSGLDPDRIRDGQEISIRAFGRPQRRVSYEVQAGDFVGGIARRYGCDIDDIVRWNPGLDPDRVRIGQDLVLFVAGPSARSESVGRANSGRLVNGERLPPHRAYVIRNDDLAWGTNETINSIVAGFDAVRARHSSAPRVRMHDLSDENGGRLSGHHSHQSGRDADIGYYTVGCSGTCDYRDQRPSELDVVLQWALIRHWINHDQIEYIFMDYSLQEPLYEYVRDVRGATAEQLNEWFQYPHGRRTARGIMRHEPNHRDHIHVRFGCPSDDDDCR